MIRAESGPSIQSEIPRIYRVRGEISSSPAPIKSSLWLADAIVVLFLKRSFVLKRKITQLAIMAGGVLFIS